MMIMTQVGHEVTIENIFVDGAPMIAQMIEVLVLAIFHLVVQVKNIKNGGRNNSLHLKYWWDSNSKINPAESSYPYYRVTFDKWGRTISQKVLSEQTVGKRRVYRYRLNRLIQVDNYNETGMLVSYERPIYKYFIYAEKTERYAPDGTLLEVIIEEYQ
jgi:hypothetical protein